MIINEETTKWQWHIIKQALELETDQASATSKLKSYEEEEYKLELQLPNRTDT